MFRPRAMTRHISWLLVCFYVLASCRALVPGLCATQAAILDGQRDAEKAAVEATHACCSLAQPANDSSEESPHPNRPAPKCAFCELAKGYVTPSPSVTVEIVTESRDERPFAFAESYHVTRVWDPGLARDPPAFDLT